MSQPSDPNGTTSFADIEACHQKASPLPSKREGGRADEMKKGVLDFGLGLLSRAVIGREET